MKKCRICSAEVIPFLDFGKMPIGNAFVKEKEFLNEFFYHMQVAVCSSCFTMQVLDVPDPQKMFHDSYAYFASTSAYMLDHFRMMSESLISKFVSEKNPFVVEIGCNDGISLQNFANAGIPHLGVEPSENVAEEARNKGINVVSEFFNAQMAEDILRKNGPADLFIATNTMHHIENINSVAEGVSNLLKPMGVMVQEDPYLGDMLESTAYDQLYAEHMYIWSITSLNNAFNPHGLEIFDIERNQHHGGCMRYFICRTGAYSQTPRYLEQINHEKQMGLESIETYIEFRKRCEKSRDNLINLLNELRLKNKKVIGYGATAKSATIINYCGIGVEHIQFITDSTPVKQGKFSPGAHIPIVKPEEMARIDPDYAVLFAWNHLEEINRKEKDFVERSGKWIIPVRMVEIV